MFIELIATIFAGIAGAGVFMLLNKGLGGRLPRWLVPVAAGAAMIAATVSNEYTWFSRTAGGMPDGLEIAQTNESQALYRPWTYIWPFVDRFVAVDMSAMITHPDHPDLRLTDTYFFGRWAPVNRLPVLADCNEGRRAAIMDGIAFSADGNVLDADWVTVPTDDPLLQTICGAA